ncbi:TIGR00266 family protein [Romboutsia weinsteinii]|uniref:TIGR00266 family protein n=1 Tax=Romboutsia weinsteinii TaxID=2020949 RepID=A0A371J5J2_9FIRM|nr:TIGR00266 family protein [Romboutsia weinsteinii]RDY28019.1 TIGR00266 family protein [Romboutsia weinsteinii]
MKSHDVDFQLYGNDMQFVEIELDPKETVIAEAGAMMMMDQNIEMETIFGDGSKKSSSGLFGALGGAAKRVLTGESLFMTAFTNAGNNKERVSFASPYPGKIIPVDLSLVGGKLICQKDAFLCAAKGVSVGIDFRKKLSVGFFGGEGFILQKLEGDGLCFIHAGGTIVKKELIPGQKLKVDTGCLVAMSKDIHYDIEFVGGIKNTLFGGEGIFFATLTGPGDVWIQSLPFSRLASKVFASAPQNYGDQRGEGSILGSFGNMFEK